MMVADAAAYAVVLAHIGPVALAVTSSLTINFLRKPEPVGVIGEASLLKLGRTLAVAEVRLRSTGRDDLVANAVVTYAIPSTAD
jgi:acyl-coenzyme A thioesterase PaaI-like protein